MSFEHPYNIQKTSERHFMILISVRTSCFWHIFKTFITYKRRQKDILYFDSKHKMFLRRLFNIHNVQKTSKKHLVFLLKIGWLYEMSVLWHLRDVSEIFFLLIQHFFFQTKEELLTNMSKQVENVNNIEEFTAMTNALSGITHSNINNQSSVSYITAAMECKLMPEMSLKRQSNLHRMAVFDIILKRSYQI